LEEEGVLMPGAALAVPCPGGWPRSTGPCLSALGTGQSLSFLWMGLAYCLGRPVQRQQPSCSGPAALLSWPSASAPSPSRLGRCRRSFAQWLAAGAVGVFSFFDSRCRRARGWPGVQGGAAALAVEPPGPSLLACGCGPQAGGGGGPRWAARPQARALAENSGEEARRLERPCHDPSEARSPPGSAAPNRQRLQLGRRLPPGGSCRALA